MGEPGQRYRAGILLGIFLWCNKHVVRNMGLTWFRQEPAGLARPAKLLRLVKQGKPIHANDIEVSVPDFVPEAWVEQFSTEKAVA